MSRLTTVFSCRGISIIRNGHIDTELGPGTLPRSQAGVTQIDVVDVLILRILVRIIVNIPVSVITVVNAV